MSAQSMVTHVPMHFTVTPCYASKKGTTGWKAAVLYVTQTQSRLYVWNGKQLEATRSSEDWMIDWGQRL